MNEVNLALTLTAAALLGCGVYLMLERSLSRVLVGLVLIGNGVSIAFLVASGPAGAPPILGKDAELVDSRAPGIADPLPQAMVLTAIVITLATTAFVLAMAYRSWQLNGHDDVQDDAEDAMIRRLAGADVTSDAYGDLDPADVAETSDFSEGDVDQDPDAEEAQVPS